MIQTIFWSRRIKEKKHDMQADMQSADTWRQARRMQVGKTYTCERDVWPWNMPEGSDAIWL